MARELYLVRHGKTMFNEKRVIQGWCDSPLTREGEEQAERIGRYFAREGISFDHAYTSTLTRTQQTIECIVDMPYERVQDLREWGFGAFEGERVCLMPAFPWGDFYVPFGGESQADVLAVSHGSACREFLSHWVPEGGYDRGGVPGNCSIMRFAYDDGVFSLSEVIEQDRLRELLGE